MAIEIERKFLLASDAWREQVYASRPMRQGYLNDSGRASVRVRLAGDDATLNIKAAVAGVSRAEYCYEIPVVDAQTMLDTLAGQVVEKTRHLIKQGDHLWEIDEFAGDNAGLIVAEIELGTEDEAFVRPDWLGAEVSDDARYYNHALALTPYTHWSP